MQLTLGPILFYWTREDILRFYAEALSWPLERIYLGEVVCSRRQQMRGSDWISLAEDLAAGGREVVLSCQALLESESDLKRVRRFVENGQFQIEANDLGAARLAQQHGLPFIAGPHLNLYNADALALFQRLGARRWLPPVEMNRDMLASVLQQARAQDVTLETEVFAWGKLPLAFSARCFTARHYRLNKDDCQFRCLEHPDGMKLATRDEQDFLTINGIQTMSDGCMSLLSHLPEMQQMGVNALRISPQSQGTEAVVRAFRQALDAPEQAKTLEASLSAPGALVDGYWRGVAGIAPIENTGERHACA